MKILKILLLLFLAMSCTKRKIELYSAKNLEITVGEELRNALYIGNVKGVRSGLETMGVDSRVDADGATPLHVAVRMGHIEVVKFLVEEKNADIEVKTNGGLTPLYVAANGGHREIVKFLVEQGAQVEVTDNNGLTPLGKAALEGHVEVVRFLVEEKGANLEINIQDIPLLHMVVALGHIEVVKFLVEEKGVDVNLTNSEDRTPLHGAATVGQIEVMKFLVEEHRAQVNARNKEKRQTPLHLAADMGHIEVVQFLIDHGAEVNVKDIDGQTALHMAAGEGHRSVVAYLISRQAEIDAEASCNVTPLHFAVLRDQKEVVELLVEHGANVKARAIPFGTPQETAERVGHREIVTYFENHKRKLAFTQALERDDVERVKQILETGHIRVNTPIDGECTSLYLTAEKGCKEIVKIFVENEEEDTLKKVIDQRDYNLSPLYIAVQNGYFEIVKLLIYGKAESNHSRAENREKVIEGEAVRDREASVENLINQEGETLLHVAAAKGYELIVRLLVEFMAIAAEKYEDSQDKPEDQGHVMRELRYVNRGDNYGTTAEALARDAGFTAIANFLKEVKENIEEKRKSLDKDAAVLSGYGVGASAGATPGVAAALQYNKAYQTQDWAHKRHGLISEARKIWRNKEDRLWNTTSPISHLEISKKAKYLIEIIKKPDKKRRKRAGEFLRKEKDFQKIKELITQKVSNNKSALEEAAVYSDKFLKNQKMVITLLSHSDDTGKKLAEEIKNLNTQKELEEKIKDLI